MTTSGQAARYVLGGLGGLGVSLAVTALMREAAGLSDELSFAIALAVVFGFYFVVNAVFVFRSGVSGRNLLRYTVASLTFRALDFLLFSGIAAVAPVYVAVALAVGLSNSGKFLVYRRFVFVPAA